VIAAGEKLNMVPPVVGALNCRLREEDIKVQDLRNTLDEILSGKQISNPKTKAFGCTIKRV